jgi:membrane protease YdiL (CAAX protease family)
LLPLVLLFAATNAWSEEIISRFVIVAGLYGKLSPSVICWISAVIFGGPHFFGTPSGIFGVMMAGLMGWILAKSMLEQKHSDGRYSSIFSRTSSSSAGER